MHNPPLLIGHRGAPGYYPEHTVSSYRAAFTQGADAVEPDIVVSKDGVLVIRHDCEISETTNIAQIPQFAERKTSKIIDGVALNGWFAEDFTWQELQTLRCRERLPALRYQSAHHDNTEEIISLGQLLQLIDTESARLGRELSVVIELKHVSYLASLGFDVPQLLISELEAHGWQHKLHRVVIECFELNALKQLKNLGLEAKLVFLMEHTGEPADAHLNFAANSADLSEKEPKISDSKHSYSWYRTPAGLKHLARFVHGISLDKQTLFVRDSEGFATEISDIVDCAHAAGLTVYTWTLRPENIFLEATDASCTAATNPAAFGDWQSEWLQIFASGVDGVFVDHPDLAFGLLRDFISADSQSKHFK